MLRPPLSSSLSSSGPSRLQISVPAATDAVSTWNTPRSEAPTTPTTPSPLKSRNDIFSLDWSSSVTPNVSSRASTPVNSPSPRPDWRLSRHEPAKVSSPRSASEQQKSPSAPVTSSTSPSRLSFARRLSFAKTGKGGHHEIPTRTEQRDQGLQIPVEHFDQSSAQELQILDPTEQDRRRHQGAGPIGSTAGISDNPVLDSRQSPRVRLVPNSEYLLGEGRHASVYLSSYIPRHLHQTADAWKLCAAKRVLPDRDSQLAGLGEAFILSKLNAPPPTSSLRSFAPRGSRFVIDLYGVRDERDGVESMGTEDQTARRKKAWNDANSAASLGLGRPLNSASSHSNLRASSEVVTASSLPQRRSLRRKKSFEPSNLSPPIGSPSIESPGHEYFPMPRSVTNVERKGPRYSAPGGLAPPPTIGSVSADSRTAAGTRIPSGTSTSTVSDGTARESKPSTPRIILLLEYAPYGHVLTFAQSYPERMGRKRWLDWAKQLVAAVAWSHERGVLHSDIKPQNVLIAADMTIRLADFGMSMFLPPPDSALPLPSDPMGLGTPAYCSPEFVRPPPSPFGRPSDIFSLGVTLTVLISGHEPYENMRSVERMLWVGRGGYWDWETRRREGGLESASVSRAGSIRSGRTRSRAGSGASAVSALAGVPSLSAAASGRRSSSVESERSARSVASACGQAGPRTLAQSAVRLLARERRGEDSPDQEPTTDLLIPPPSPPLGSDDESNDDARAGVGGADPEQLGTEGAIPFPTIGETYSDGTPAVYFLNGVDVVPQQVLALLQAMTHPKPGHRPSAAEVLNSLDDL